jgi:predicted nucleotidyltransferase
VKIIQIKHVSKGRTDDLDNLHAINTHLEEVREIFSRQAEIRRVKIFGSRVSSNFERYSDIDLVLWGDLNPKLLGRILSVLDELPLPYTFDVTSYDDIDHPQLKKALMRQEKLFIPQVKNTFTYSSFHAKGLRFCLLRISFL